MEVKILKEDEYVPSTVTMVSRFNKTINVVDISTYLPVVHLFNKKTGERLKLDSGTRTSIKYYGYEGIIISICYKKIRRGMRTGAMNNMVSLDIQHGGKNIHVKLSSNTDPSLTTSSGTPCSISFILPSASGLAVYSSYSSTFVEPFLLFIGTSSTE